MFSSNNITININLPTKNRLIGHISKIAHQPLPKQSSPTTTQNPQTSTRISFQDNPYSFEERHALLSKPLEPFQRQASLSEPTYNLYPTLPQDLNRIRHISQNQNTVEVNRQNIHPRRNRNFQTPRVYFHIPQSPTPTTSELSSSTLPESPTLLSQRSNSNIPQKNTDRKMVNFQVFDDSVHQAELERYQRLVQLDEKYPYNGAHGRLFYDIHDKHWIPHIGINDPSTAKQTQKIKDIKK